MRANPRVDAICVDSHHQRFGGYVTLVITERSPIGFTLPSSASVCDGLVGPHRLHW